MLKKIAAEAANWQLQYLSSVAVIWLAMAVYWASPYYQDALSNDTKTALLVLSFAFTLIAPFIYIFIPKDRIPKSKAYITLVMLGRVIPKLAAYLARFPFSSKAKVPAITEQERVASLFLVVKIFFLPIMINFLFTNFFSVKEGYQSAQDADSLFSIAGFNELIFPVVFSALLLIDTAYFVFGYLFEAGFLNNKVRSVEPTVLGWAVALICYPPFNGILGTYVVWRANDYVSYWNEEITFIMRILALILMAIYAFSSVALGAKCSNLTNRGIVSRGPYALVRHPAYISKNLAWWLTILPVISVAAVAGMLVWTFIYYLRSITEERHLIRDPDYQAYCQKVKYRFIPKLI